MCVDLLFTTVCLWGGWWIFASWFSGVWCLLGLNMMLGDLDCVLLCLVGGLALLRFDLLFVCDLFAFG